jgi:hypothetical protein
VLWLSWFCAERCQEVLREGGFAGDLAGFGRWLGLRAQAKVQGDVVSNGWWLLWTMLVHKRELCWAGPAAVEEEEEEDADAVGVAGSRSPITIGHPVGTADDVSIEHPEEPGTLTLESPGCSVTGFFRHTKRVRAYAI